MSVSSEVVSIRDQDVEIAEGDLLCTHCTNWWAWAVGVANGGISHVSTVVRVQGRLVAVSVCSGQWKDESGRVWPDGITVEPLYLFADKAYDAFWVASPTTPRTEAQLVRLRLAVAELLKQNAGKHGEVYDTMTEFAHSCFGLPRASDRQWHCGELAAELCKVQGEWPPNATTSVPLTTLVARFGTMRRIY